MTLSKLVFPNVSKPISVSRISPFLICGCERLSVFIRAAFLTRFDFPNICPTIDKDSGIECFSCGANSAIFNWLKEHKDRKVLVIADRAAFGSEIDRVLKLQSSANFKLCLPESFEWLVLKSGLIRTGDITLILETPSDFIESSEYFSWENFFEKYLIENTVTTPFQYAKHEINPIYLIKENSERIIAEVYI